MKYVKMKTLCEIVRVKEETAMELSYGKKELEQIAKLYGIKGAYKMKKAELTEALLEAIPQKMPQILPMLDEEDIIKFEALLGKNKVLENEEEVEGYYNLMELELVQVREANEKIELVVAELVKDAYKKIDMTPIMKEIRTHSSIRKYVISVLNLYGAVKLSWAKELYNRSNSDSINELELAQFVKTDMRLMCQCKIIEEYIVEETIYALDKTNFKDFIEAITERGYYIPSEALLEAMYDERYYESSIPIEKLKAYLRKTYMVEEALIEEIIIAITMIARVDCDRSGKTTEIILEEIANLGVEFTNLAEVNEMAKHIISITGGTRKWINKGFTNQELSPHTFDEKTGQKIKVIDIGRNAPCPCGSGKKYKKCCANKQ